MLMDPNPPWAIRWSVRHVGYTWLWPRPVLVVQEDHDLGDATSLLGLAEASAGGQEIRKER